MAMAFPYWNSDMHPPLRSTGFFTCQAPAFWPTVCFKLNHPAGAAAVKRPIRQTDQEAGGLLTTRTAMAAIETGLSERRRHARRSIALAVRVFVLMEELTFSPLQFEGTVLNLSRGGALASVRGLPREHYQKLIHRPRFVRLSCPFPGTEKPVLLFGKLVWYDFQEDSDGSLCRLALTFEPMSKEILAALDRYLESLVGGPDSQVGA